jgi:hypothetical protein
MQDIMSTIFNIVYSPSIFFIISFPRPSPSRLPQGNGKRREERAWVEEMIENENIVNEIMTVIASCVVAVLAAGS